MKNVLIVLGTLVLAAALVAGGLWLGAAWTHGRAAASTAVCTAGRTGMMGGSRPGAACGAPGTTGRFGQGALCDRCAVTTGQGQVGSLGDAKAAVETYVQSLGYAGLVVKEVMEFEKNYYAIVSEEGTGIGAMELLVDKETGAVGPEQGPNRMWNAKYGMMAGRGGMMGRRGMMGRTTTGEMTVSAEEAGQIAQKWLDENLPGRTAGEADAFYGYYTFHFLKDGQVDGMLSVNGSSGEVWYHNWHGAFVDMIEEGK